ncbi:TonB-dependent receptor domain-containing protein [Silvibacterium sp.]|uniref:TonB-dependent receptor n=1 Tax=Silvibacterium sp. TaxID=1964179 RepID=UPI0039E4AE34
MRRTDGFNARWACVSLMLLLLLLGGGLRAAGQGITTGSIAGTVVDGSGAVVQNATVTATNVGTNYHSQQQTRGDGSFSIVNVPVGSYSLTIEAQGFDKLSISVVNVVVGETNIGPQKLTIGSTSVVQVEGNATPLLDTSQAQVSNTIDAQMLQNLPFGGGFDTAALLSPGVVITHDNSFSNSNGSYGGFSSQGQRGRSNNFELDGQSNNDNSVAGPQVFFSNEDALDNVQVITNNFSAQYGRNAGSVVNYVTRSGSNQFHGSAFYRYEGNWGESFAQGQKSSWQGYCAPGQQPTSENACVTPTLTRFTDNVVGGTLGGPVLKDKLFFFGSAYFNRNHTGGGESVLTSSITPTPTGLSQLASAFPSSPGVAALVNNGPYSITTGNPQVAGTTYQVPVTYNGTTIDVPFAGVVRSVPSQSNDEEVMGRLDWQPGTRDHVFIRYFYQDDPSVNAGGSVPEGNWYNVPDHAQSVGGDWEHTFTSNFVNQLRYSFQQTSLLFQGGAQPNCTVTTPDQCTANISLSGKVADTNGDELGLMSYGYATNLPQGRTVKVTQVQDNATWTSGKQTILFGGEWSYQNSPNPFLPYYEGALAFSGSSTDPTNPLLTNFLDGTTSSFTLANGNFTTKFTEPDYAAYFQDDWKLTPNFTVNLGLRYEFFTQAVNLLHDETVKREEDAATAYWDQSLPLSVRTYPYTKPAYKNFQPRLGFAYSPASLKDKFVVRGGFAINFDPAFYNMFINAASSAPVVNNGSITGCGTTISCLPSTGVLASEVRGQDLQYIPTGVGINPGTRNTTNNSSNFRNPYTESWYFGFETALGSKASLDVKYVGNHQVAQFQSIDGNPYLLDIKSAFPNYANVDLCTDTTAPGYGRPNCNYSNVRERDNGAFALYNSLQFQLQTHKWHGLTTIANYSYSRTIDNASEVYGTYAGGATIAFSQNPLDPNQAERALSGISLKHVASAGAHYELPFFAEERNLAGKALGGWILGIIYTFDSGQPGTPYQYGFFGDGAGYQSYSDDVSFLNWQLGGYDVARPVLSNKKAPINTVGVYDPDGSVCGVGQGFYNWADCSQISPSQVHWLRNTQALVNYLGSKTPYIGVGRDTVFSKTWSNLDLDLFKEEKVNEKLRVQFQLDMYNALNNQNLGMPDLGIDDVSSSPSSNTFEDSRWSYGHNRNTQLGIKFLF